MQGIAGSCGDRFKWNRYVFGTQLAGQAQHRSQLEE